MRGKVLCIDRSDQFTAFGVRSTQMMVEIYNKCLLLFNVPFEVDHLIVNQIIAAFYSQV